MVRPNSLSLMGRTRIVRDLLYWKTELERTNGSLTNNTQTDFVAMCLKHSDSKLIDFWYQTVGEWVLSRDSTSLPDTVTADTYLDYQVGLLLDGQETDYGFIVSPSLTVVLQRLESDPDVELAQLNPVIK